MNDKVEIENLEIDLETLADAYYMVSMGETDEARRIIVAKIVKALSPEDKRKLERRH